jgi:hypothetical protein
MEKLSARWVEDSIKQEEWYEAGVALKAAELMFAAYQIICMPMNIASNQYCYRYK